MANPWTSRFSRQQYCWLIVGLLALGLLAVGGVRMVLRQDGRETVPVGKAGKAQRSTQPADTAQDSSVNGTGQTPKETAFDAGADSAARDIQSGAGPSARMDTEGKVRPRLGPSGIEMSGPAPYIVISTEIFEWAREKTAAELISVIARSQGPFAFDEHNLEELGERLSRMTREEIDAFMEANPQFVVPKLEDLDKYQPWQNVAMIKASWALALKLSEDPGIFETIKATLLSGNLSSHAASRLVEIIAFMPDQQATDILRALTRMHRPPVPWAVLIAALGGRTGAQERRPIVDYITELDYIRPAERDEFPAMWVSAERAPDPEIVTFLANLLASQLVVEDEAARDTLLEYMSFLAAVCHDIAENPTAAERETFKGLSEQIRENATMLTKLSDDASFRAAAWEFLGSLPVSKDGWQPLVAALTGSRSDRERLSAVTALAPYADIPEVTTALLQTAKSDTIPPIRWHAISALPRTGSAGAEKLALSLAWHSRGGEHITREEGIMLLGTCGAEAIPHLQRIAAEDRSARLRKLAASQVALLNAREERARKRVERKR